MFETAYGFIDVIGVDLKEKKRSKKEIYIILSVDDWQCVNYSPY